MNGVLSDRKRNRALEIACIVFLILAIVPVSLGFFYERTANDLSSQALLDQQTVASITATAIKIKLDQLASIAQAMASSPQLVSFSSEGQWNDAVNVTRDLQNNPLFYDPAIDRVVLFDKSGIEQAAYPTLASGVGSSASTSGWYRALTAGGVPFYVSSVNQRTATPRINVINIAVPIAQNGVKQGFLVLQIPTASFLTFGESASLGTYGFIYIVDSEGNVVIHPKFPLDSDVVNLASIPIVEKSLADKEGFAMLPGEGDAKSVASYQVVPGYNWEVVAQEPYAEVFATRDSILWLIMWEIIASLLISILVACLVFSFLTSKNLQTKSKR